MTVEGGARGVDEVRLRLLREADGDLSEGEVLRLALQHATLAVGGLGGVAHWLIRDEPNEPVLRLAAMTGLSEGLARLWRRVAADGGQAPARAVREGRAAWDDTGSPADNGPQPGTDLLAGTGVLAVPIMGDGHAVGALSVFFPGPQPPPPPRQAFLSELAAVTGERLRHARKRRDEVPTDLDGQQGNRAQTVGSWTWELDSGLLTADELGERIMREAAGLEPGTWDGHIDTWLGRIVPEDRPAVEAAIDRALRERRVFTAEYRVRDGSGRVSWLEVRGHIDYAGDGVTPLRMHGTAWDITAGRWPHEWLTELLERHPDPLQVINENDLVVYANVRARELAAAQGLDLLGRVPWEAIPALGAAGMREQFARARTQDEPVSFKSHTLETEPGSEFPVDRWWQVRVVRIGRFLAKQWSEITAQERAKRAARERRERIETFTAALAKALTVEDVVAATAEHVLPPFGASGLIMHEMTGGLPRLVGVIGYSDDFAERVQRLDGTQQAAISALDSPAFISSPEASAEFFPQFTALVGTGGRQAWAVLPLHASGRKVGTCMVSWDAPREFGGDETGLLLALSGLIAQALERARLFDDTNGRAQELQSSLLPGELPTLPGVTAAAAYQPAGDEAMGGDWYDIIRLSGERVALVAGDVMGHGLREAITMGRVRTAVNTLADLEQPPEDVLGHLNDIMSKIVDPSGGTHVTCLYIVYDPVVGSCTMASAGHPPPAVVEPGGGVSFPEIEAGPPLGVEQRPYPVTELPLPEGSLLVLYTNGLIGTAAGQDYDAGLARLVAVLADAADPAPPPADRGPEELRWLRRQCERLTSAIPLDGHRSRDDAAVLALRCHRLPEDSVVSWDLPYSPASAGQARELTKQRLARWGQEERAWVVDLVVSELIGNVVRHATGLDGSWDEGEAEGRGSGIIRLRMIWSGQRLTTEVYDGSEATPRIRSAAPDEEGGRGLFLVAAMADRWGARYTRGGKCIWAEWHV